MKVLVTGAGGQAGREVAATKPESCRLVAADRSMLDITDVDATRRLVEAERPDWIVNAAAYTAVDKAESDVDAARRINAEASGHLAQVAAGCGARLLHLSTDFVFDGERSRPYRPEDATHALGAYGATKLEGEAAVLRGSGGSAIVLRTSWLYSMHPPNFVLRMLELLGSRPELRVVADQVGSPTWARGLADCVWALMSTEPRGGVYHWSDAGVASWYDFSVAIQELAVSLNLLRGGARIVPIRTDEYPTPARRPHYSVLDTRGTTEAVGCAPVHWRVNLGRMLGELAGSAHGRPG